MKLLAILLVFTFSTVSFQSIVAKGVTDWQSFREIWKIKETRLGVDISPDGEKIIVTHEERIEIRDVWDGSLIQTIDTGVGPSYAINGPYRAKWSPNGSWIASYLWTVDVPPGVHLWEQRKVIMIWDADNGELVNTFKVNNTIVEVQWSPDGSMVAIGTGWIPGIDPPGMQNWTIIIDTSNGDIIRQFPAPTTIISIDWSPDGSKIIAAYRRGAEVWEVSSGESLIRLDVDISESGFVVGADHTVTDWSPDGEKVALATHTTIEIWDAQEWDLLNTFEEKHETEYNYSIFKVKWAPNASILASTSGLNVKFWDDINGTLLGSVCPSDQNVLDFSWHPDGENIAIAGLDGICVWGIKNPSAMTIMIVGLVIIGIVCGVGLIFFISKNRTVKKQRI